MPRNYTVPTIKTLFGEASTCAYPGCEEPLIFRDRGATTVVAEIAHIRSEQPDGPRHDPAYTGDINGPKNLLLLCGKHHRPVDRHEVVYSVTELEGWKAAQRDSAGQGTPLTESDVRSYARLTEEERRIIQQIARLSERVVRAGREVQRAVDHVRNRAEEARLEAERRSPALYELNDDGTVRRRLPYDLPWIEQQRWRDTELATRDLELPRVRQALDDLASEVAVLRMISRPLGEAGDVALAAAGRIEDAVGNPSRLAAAVDLVDTARTHLWRVANGEENPTEAGVA